MFGLWFSLAGLLFGILCSYYAGEKKRASKEWFMLGFIFSFIALGILYLLPNNEIMETEDKFQSQNDFFLPIQSH
ncbi:MAG: hypothetical protein ACYC4T_04940 [Melioribacteraceae bacterium]